MEGFMQVSKLFFHWLNKSGNFYTFGGNLGWNMSIRVKIFDIINAEQNGGESYGNKLRNLYNLFFTDVYTVELIATAKNFYWRGKWTDWTAWKEGKTRKKQRNFQSTNRQLREKRGYSVYKICQIRGQNWLGSRHLENQRSWKSNYCNDVQVR